MFIHVCVMYACSNFLFIYMKVSLKEPGKDAASRRNQKFWLEEVFLCTHIRIIIVNLYYSIQLYESII